MQNLKKYIALIMFPVLVMTSCADGGGKKKEVPDTIAPVITVSGGSSINVEQGSSYTDAGATATDNKDGTVSVSSTGTVNAAAAGTYTITYTATDSAGNSSTATRTVTVADTVAPVISLNGDQKIDLDYSAEYADEGATAQDTVDGAVTVTVEGSFDTFVSGSYDLTYSAVDIAGNTSSLVRTLDVAEQKFRLDVSVFGNGALTVEGVDALECNIVGDICTQLYEKGTLVSIVPQADSGWSFDDWKNCDTLEGDTCNVTVNSNRLVLTSYTNDAPLVLEDDVIELTDVQIQAIQNFEIDANVLTFSAGSDIANLTVGKVIVAIDTSGSDVFFARRILDIVSLPGSVTFMETRNASIEEVIKEGTISASPVITVDSVVESSLPKGVFLRKGTDTDRITIPLGLLGVEVYKTANTTITVTGSLDIEVQPDIDYNFALTRGLVSFRFATEQTTSANFAVEISGDVSALMTEKRFDLKAINLGYVIVGPTVFVLSVQPYLTFEAGISVSVEPNITFTQIATIGLQWHKDSDFTNLSDYALTADVAFPTTLSANATMRVGAGLKTAIKLYGVVGPFLEGRVYGGGKLAITPLAECPVVFSSFVGGDIKIGGEITLLSEYLRFTSNPIFYEQQITENKIGCDEDIEAPSIPGQLSVSAQSSTELNLTWQASTDNVLVQGYEIWRRSFNGGRPHYIEVVSNTSYVDRILKSEKEYCYYIRAIDISGNRSSIPANLICATTLEPEDVEPPSIPVDFISDLQTTSAIDLMWSASSDNEEVSGYVIFDYTGGEEAAFIAGETTDLNITIRSLNPDAQYCYIIVAVDRRGNVSDISDVICYTTKPKTEAEWVVFIGCQNREFLLQENLEIDEDNNSRVEVTGQGNDYGGTRLAYILAGIFEAETGMLSADINWSFEGSARRRTDRFTADLSTGDSGIVAMDQIKVTGCDAQIQFVRNDQTSQKMTPIFVRASAENSDQSLGMISQF